MVDNLDYYNILGLKRSASLREIKSRFRKLALRYHPDRNPENPGSEEHFKLIAEAYHVLSNHERRHLFNKHGHQGLKATGYRGFEHTQDVFKTFGAELFSFLGVSRSRPQRGPLPGADLCIQLVLSHEEAALGVKKTVWIITMQGCLQCRGNGYRPTSRQQSCPWCGGSGKFQGTSQIFAAAGVCPKCNGQGRLAQALCKSCDGLGRRQVRKSLEVSIPAGVKDRTRLKISHAGDGGEYGGKPGDLYLVLHIPKGREEDF
jgi:molecular chaperone DnaJ